MYNVTPHGTIGSPPTELMFNRVIRDKIPGIHDISDAYFETEEKDRDAREKHKGKILADTNRGAKNGDKVLVKNVILTNKLTPTFDKTEYEVKEKNGNIVKVDGGGRILTRNVCHLKKIPKTSESTIVEAQLTDAIPLGPPTKDVSSAPMSALAATAEENSNQDSLISTIIGSHEF
ncbi:hypothetical protein ACLKA6_019230 [Drosophila palustris]